MNTRSARPIVSVVMAAHNAMPYLPEAVESILQQSLRDFEFIIVNDGSTDGSAAWLDSRAADDPRVRVLNQENIGLTKSLNRGLNAAHGKFIARMDADDVSLPGRLEAQVRHLQSHPDLGVVGTFAETINAKGDRIGRVKPASRVVGHLQAQWQLLFKNAMVHPSVMMPKDVALSLGGYDCRWNTSQDYDLWSRISEVYKVANLPQVHLHYRVHGKSISSSRSKIQRENSRAISTRNISRLNLDLTPRQILSLQNVYGNSDGWTSENIIHAAGVLPDVYHAFRRAKTHSEEEVEAIRSIVATEVMRGIRHFRAQSIQHPKSCIGGIMKLQPWRWLRYQNAFVLRRACDSLIGSGRRVPADKLN